MSFPIRVCLLLGAGNLCMVSSFTPKDSAHCVQWKESDVDARAEDLATAIRAEANHGDPTEAEAKLCRPRKIVLEDNVEQTCEDSDPWCRIVAVGNASVLLNFGVITAVDNIAELPDTFACIPMYLGNNSTGEDLHKFKHVPFDGVSTDPSCDVFWREVSADVIPPIPELVLAFGESPQGHKMGLCRTFGDDVTIDDGKRVLGTIALEGPDFGRCFFVRADGSTSAIDGGMFHVLQARAAEVQCVDNVADQQTYAAGLQHRVDTFIIQEDLDVMEQVTGHSAADLIAATVALGSCDLKQVLSPARFLPHALNMQGLHLLRCLLAERMSVARAVSRGFDQDPDFATWREQGYIVKDFDAIGDEGLHRLLQIVSGETVLAIPQPPYTWVGRNVTVPEARDPQNHMHVDTFASIVKVWIFEADVTMEQGPLTYVPGSQRNTKEKLEWMYAYSLPPATEALVEPSFRLHGCPAATKAGATYVQHCEDTKVAMLPLPGVQRTLVIADTSGLYSGFTL